VSQDDPNAKNKMNAAGFTAEDGSIWLNADNISSMNNFDLNSVFAHEGTHKVTGKNTELLADFGQSRAEKFINKSIDKGYLTRTGGGLNWEDGNLTEEQKQRLAEYTNEDMQYFFDGLFRGIGGDKVVNKLQDKARKGASKVFGKSGEAFVNNVINLDKKTFNNEGKAVGNAVHNVIKKATGVDTRKLGDQVVNVVENIQNRKPAPKKRSTKKTPPKKNTTNSNNSNNKKNNNIKEKIKNRVETGLEIGRETVINGGYFVWGGVSAIAEDATLGVAVLRDREGNKVEPNNKFYYAGQLAGHLLTTFEGTGGAVGGTGVEIVAIGAGPETAGVSMVATIPAEAVKTYSAGVATKGAFGITESLIKLSNPKNSSNSGSSTNNKNSNNGNTIRRGHFNGEYKPSPKHKGPKMPPNASPDSIPDIKTGNDLLKNHSYNSATKKQRFAIYKGKMIIFQPTGTKNEWHAYEITENLRKHVPNDTLKQMLKDGKITKVQYNKNRMK
jgi:hypothetical protein cdivTM_02396